MHPGVERGISALFAALVCALFFLALNCKESADVTTQEKKGDTGADISDKATFVERALCRECHEDHYAEWVGSHHDRSMDIAAEKTVKGDFEGAVFTHHDATFRFHKGYGKFFLGVEGTEEESHEYEIRYVIGTDPLQRYMIQFPDGRIEVPDIAWDSRPRVRGGQRWMHIPSPGDAAPQGGGDRPERFLNGNSMCGECHATNFKKNYDLEKDTFGSSWSMIDVGCQACHGPGSKHVAWAGAPEDQKSAITASGPMGLEVDLGADESDAEVEACARCHSGRFGLRSEYEFGKEFLDNYVPRVLTYPWYYPDGQIRGDVYEYGSFLQSKKYSRGIRCSDCHDPHTARLLTYGNELCIHCHSSPPAEQFSYLKDKNYDSPLHHFHKEHSPGSQCISCHMPETAFMEVDARRDHSFQVPRPDRSGKLNTPNPCNRCHADKSAEWAANKIDEVHPLSRQNREKGKNVAELFHAGQAGDREAVPGLIELAADKSAPAIVRATGLNILSGFKGQKAFDSTARSLLDEDPLVRYEAVKGLSALIPGTAGPEDQKKKYALLAPRLKDSVRAVRSEAGRAVAEVPGEFRSAAGMHDFERALEEYKERLLVSAERPEAHFDLGILYENLGQDDMAVRSYRTAMRLDKEFFPARFRLADVYARTGDHNGAEQQYREIIRLDPEHARAHHLLGTLLSKFNRLDEAVAFLGRAVQYMPGSARVRYDYALTLRHLGDNNEALNEMLTAHAIDQKDPAIVQAIANFYMQDGQWENALFFTQLLVQSAPDAERPKHMLKQIQEALKEAKKSSQ